MRSFRELCEELGVSRYQMVGLMSAYPGCPAPALQHKNPRAESNSWYNPAEFRRWFASIPRK
jgi:transposase